MLNIQIEAFGQDLHGIPHSEIATNLNAMLVANNITDITLTATEVKTLIDAENIAYAIASSATAPLVPVGKE